MLNVCLSYEALASDVSSRNLKMMSDKEVRGLDRRLDVRNDDPGGIMA